MLSIVIPKYNAFVVGKLYFYSNNNDLMTDRKVANLFFIVTGNKLSLESDSHFGGN